MFCILNIVVPEAEADIRSPEFVLLTIREAFDPIPPDTESGAGVLACEPIRIPVSESDVRIVFPVPLGVRVRLSSEIVPMVACAPPPRLSVVESIPRVEAASIVARAPALIVVRPEALSVVSSAAIVRVLLPESRVRVDTVDASVPAPANVRELILRTVPSTLMKPRSALSLMVTDPVPALTSNSVKSIAVAPPLIDVRLVPFSVVVELRFTV